MKYEIDLPADVGERLAAKACESGEDVPHLIRLAVVRFVEMELGGSSNGQWSEAAESRRRELIDKEIAGEVTTAERTELERLDRLANEHFDRVAPPALEGARRLHEKLVKKRASHN